MNEQDYIRLKRLEQIPRDVSKDAPLSEKLDALNKKVDYQLANPNEGKKKWFKMPWKVKNKQKRLAKTGKLQVIFMRENRNIEPLVCPMEDGMIKLNGKFYNAAEAFVYLWLGKFPTIVLPEWSLVPVGQQFDELEDKTKSVYAETHIIAAMQKAELEDKKKISSKTIIWILIVAIVVGYLLFAGIPGTSGG